jgi:sialidase-1
MRRRFLRDGIGALLVGLSSGLPLRADGAPIFQAYIVGPQKTGTPEATLDKLDDGRYWLLFSTRERRLMSKTSTDKGRTWGSPQPVLEEDGRPIETASSAAHLRILHLKSGALGMIHGGPRTRPGRDGTILYRMSKNQGATWSAPMAVDPIFAICRTAGARVLTTGRIVVPSFKWFSSFTGGESESESNNICLSWVFYSDDEGTTWKRSLSEMFVSVDQGRQGNFSFEEPSLVELQDGRLLMFGRTELGRFYQSISNNGGVSWPAAEPVNLAASYTPPMLVRIPSTGDVLLVWNQASGEEILAGLARHRLSTAISNDGGVTWGHFHNLESLDDRAKLNAPPSTPHLYRMVDYGYRQPVDRAQYTHAPGCVRICYPTLVFDRNEVAIAYDYGSGVGEFQDAYSTKIQIVSLDWLYGG